MHIFHKWELIDFCTGNYEDDEKVAAEGYECPICKKRKIKRVKYSGWQKSTPQTIRWEINFMQGAEPREDQ